MNKNIIKYIDQTYLDCNRPKKDFDIWLAKSILIDFYSLCVRKENLQQTLNALMDVSQINDTGVSVVVNFPTEKIEKIDDVGGDIDCGIDQISEIVNVYKKHSKHIKNFSIDYVCKLANFYNNPEEFFFELNKIRETVSILIPNAETRIIVESCFIKEISDLLKIAGLISLSGNDFLKTSTGYGPEGVNIDQYKKYFEFIGCDSMLFYKASGGIKTLKQAEELLDIGFNIIGTSNGIEIAKEISLTPLPFNLKVIKEIK